MWSAASAAPVAARQQPGNSHGAAGPGHVRSAEPPRASPAWTSASSDRSRSSKGAGRWRSGPRQRALLAVLLLRANKTLAPTALHRPLWAQRPPATAAKTVQVHVSRAAQGARRGRAGRAGGHARARLPPGGRAPRGSTRGASSGWSPTRAGDLDAGEPRRGRRRWRRRAPSGADRRSPISPTGRSPRARSHASPTCGWRRTSCTSRRDWRWAPRRGGRGARGADRRAPYRERLRGAAHARAVPVRPPGRRAQAYQDARRALVDELGIEPGERLRELERAVLAQDPALALPIAQPRPAPPTMARRQPGAPPLQRLRRPPATASGGTTRLAPLAAGACGEVIERQGGERGGVGRRRDRRRLRNHRAARDDAQRAARAALRDPRSWRRSGSGFDSGRHKRRRRMRARMRPGSRYAAAAALQAAAADGEILAEGRIADLLGPSTELEPHSAGRRARRLARRRRACCRLRRILRPAASTFVSGAEGARGSCATHGGAPATRVRSYAVTVTGTKGQPEVPPGPGAAGRHRVTTRHEIAIGRCLSSGEDHRLPDRSPEWFGQVGGRRPESRGHRRCLGGDEACRARCCARSASATAHQVQADRSYSAMRSGCSVWAARAAGLDAWSTTVCAWAEQLRWTTSTTSGRVLPEAHPDPRSCASGRPEFAGDAPRVVRRRGLGRSVHHH